MVESKNIILVAEGAHDVSFIGHVLKNFGFTKETTYSGLPESWKALYPAKFPWNGDSLDRVARFPDVFTKNEIAIGIINSGSLSQLVPRLRVALEVLGPDNVCCIALFADADASDADSRFKEISESLVEMNNDAIAEGVPNFPINVPNSICSLTADKPSVGIFVFPDNSGSGTLEDILIECAKMSHSELCDHAINFIEQIDQKLEKSHSSLKKMRAGQGRRKATMGVIANVLKPGSSLAVSIEQRGLLNSKAGDLSYVSDFSNFLSKVVEQANT